MSRGKAVPASGTARGELPLPLTGILVDPVNERQVSRIWRNIATRRAVAGQVRLALRWGFVGALLGTLLTLVIVTAFSPAPVAVEAPATVGPLKLADGRPLEALEVVASSPAASTPLSDGSVIRVEPEARIEPLASSETQLVLRLTRGRAHFNVRPSGSRRWLVEAGLATIEVIGTEFTVDRSSDRVRVEVVHGLVLVRGNTLPDGVVRLGAGQSVEVRAARTPEALPEETHPATEKSARSRGAAPAGRWREALTGGGYRDAYAVLGAEGLAREAQRSESADDLFDLADVARLSGHPAEAVIPLERLLSLHAKSPRAPVAALTLGRIRLELKSPRAAAASLEQALRLGVPQGLEEDAFVRLVQAHAESGNRAEANRVFEMYTRRYPNGRRSAEARSWLGR
jgi:transmembrane sensor